MNIEDKKPEFEKIIGFLEIEFAKLRTGRANAAMVEDLKVEYYGQLTSLRGLASISVPESRQLLITPWDKGALAEIEKAIRDSNMGFNPANEGDKIRIVLPELNQERRSELSKVASRLAEEARIKVRNLREEILKDIRSQEESGKITEDDKFRFQDKLQEIVDDYNKKIKELAERKEKEIMTV